MGSGDPVRVVEAQSNRPPAVAQTAEEVNAGSDDMVSVELSLLHVGPVSVSVVTMSTSKRAKLSIRTEPRNKGRKQPGPINPISSYIT